MNTITIKKEPVATGLYLTQAGVLALATPCAVKEYISNNVRNVVGRRYLDIAVKKDDTQVSVQLVAVPDENNTLSSIMSSFSSLIGTNGDITLNGVKCKYRSTGNLTENAGVYLFNVNLIKLAE